MSAYAIGHLEQVNMGPAIVEYLRNIDATLAPYDGRFLIHGGRADVMEGSFQGDLIVIEFPDIGRARDWYNSPAYQQILPLRRDNASGHVFLLDGVPDDHEATDVLG